MEIKMIGYKQGHTIIHCTCDSLYKYFVAYIQVWSSICMWSHHLVFFGKFNCQNTIGKISSEHDHNSTNLSTFVYWQSLRQGVVDLNFEKSIGCFLIFFSLHYAFIVWNPGNDTLAYSVYTDVIQESDQCLYCYFSL